MMRKDVYPDPPQHYKNIIHLQIMVHHPILMQVTHGLCYL
jgi:hypothetical protein